MRMKKRAIALFFAAVIAGFPLYASGNGEGSSPVGSRSGALNFTQVRQREITDYMESVAFGNGRFVAVGRRGWQKGTNAAYSTDGVTWTAIPDSAFNSVDILSITFCGGKFFAINWWEGNALTSTDGVTWTRIQSSFFYHNDVRGPAYGNGKFVAVSYEGRIAHSTDGVTWTEVANVPRLRYMNIVYGGGRFVATSWDDGIAYSDDGVTWKTGSDGIVYADDGVTLKNNVRIDSIAGHSIAYGGGRFVAGTWEGGIAYSADGVTWNMTKFSDNFSPWRIVYGGGKFVAIAHDWIAYSEDGLTWTETNYHHILGDCGLGSIAYGNGRFVAVGSNGSFERPTADGYKSHSDGRIVYSNKLE